MTYLSTGQRFFSFRTVSCWCGWISMFVQKQIWFSQTKSIVRCFVKILNGNVASPAFIVKLFLQNLVYAKRAQLHQTKPEFVKENQYQLLPRHLGAYTHKASLHNNNKTINNKKLAVTGLQWKPTKVGGLRFNIFFRFTGISFCQPRSQKPWGLLLAGLCVYTAARYCCYCCYCRCYCFDIFPGHWQEPRSQKACGLFTDCVLTIIHV